ncbi:energy-coupled thiamine transporter ThiT [Vagococcus sp.]|uniref:energy-coupled thiamine transporter ThiT n=1 Tax=Vagococcus sp. TaxID=1933889 RepID=UPI003F960E2C
MALSFVLVKFGPGFSISLGKASVFSLPQALIEYVFAYLAVGVSGIVSLRFKQALSQNEKKRTVFYLTVAIIVGILSRYFFHFIAGIIFWGSCAPKGMSPMVYSFFLNGSNALFTGIVTWIALFLLLRKRPKLFLPDVR